VFFWPSLQTLTTGSGPDGRKAVLAVALGKKRRVLRPCPFSIIPGPKPASPSGCQGHFAPAGASGGAVP